MKNPRETMRSIKVLEEKYTMVFNLLNEMFNHPDYEKGDLEISIIEDLQRNLDLIEQLKECAVAPYN